jgi:hypothetical protein
MHHRCEALQFVNGWVGKSTYLREIATIRIPSFSWQYRRKSNSGKKLRQEHWARRPVLARTLQTRLEAGIALAAATFSLRLAKSRETKL